MDSVTLKMTHRAIVVVFFLSGHRGGPLSIDMIIFI